MSTPEEKAPPQAPETPAEPGPLLRACLTNDLTCTGINPCGECARMIFQQVMPKALHQSGLITRTNAAQVKTFFDAYAKEWVQLTLQLFPIHAKPVEKAPHERPLGPPAQPAPELLQQAVNGGILPQKEEVSPPTTAAAMTAEVAKMMAGARTEPGPNEEVVHASDDGIYVQEKPEGIVGLPAKPEVVTYDKVSAYPVTSPTTPTNGMTEGKALTEALDRMAVNSAYGKIKPENGHGAADEFGGTDYPAEEAPRVLPAPPNMPPLNDADLAHLAEPVDPSEVPLDIPDPAPSGVSATATETAESPLAQEKSRAVARKARDLRDRIKNRAKTADETKAEDTHG